MVKKKSYKKSFIVTGGNGYIGSHLCKFLHQLGHRVHIVDNFSTSPTYPVHPFGIFHSVDIADTEKMRALLRSESFSCLFHFAAKASVSESEAQPFFYYEENFVKTLRLLQVCSEEGLKNIIFSSTCATFGVPLTPALNEDHPQNPINSYGHSKKFMELLMRDLSIKGRLNTVVFRYFNACGASADGDMGENHEPEAHLIPNLCRSFLSGGKEIFSLYGDQYPTRDGTCIRDYIHVDDLAKVHYEGALFLENHPGFHDFNLGSEQGHSVKEVIAAFEKVTGQPLLLQLCPPRPGDPPSLVADSTKAKKYLAFAPQFSLQESIEHALRWEKKKLKFP